jgi:hypothetical protein
MINDRSNAADAARALTNGYIRPNRLFRLLIFRFFVSKSSTSDGVGLAKLSREPGNEGSSIGGARSFAARAIILGLRSLAISCSCNICGGTGGSSSIGSLSSAPRGTSFRRFEWADSG